MADVPFPQRVIRMIGASDLADQVGNAQVAVYGPIVPWAGRSRLLRTSVLGHSVHPPMTDLTLGCWTSALLLGDRRSRLGVDDRRGAPHRCGARPRHRRRDFLLRG